MAEQLSAPKLKKCPFCGCWLKVGKGKRLKSGEWWFRPAINHKCGIGKHPEARMYIHLEGESAEEVAAIWNTRIGE